MDAPESMRVISETLHGSSSAYSQWQFWNLGIFGEVWVRYRKIEWVLHIVGLRIKQTCELTCSGGYRLSGDGLCHWPYPIDAPFGKAIPPHHAVATTATPFAEDDRWTEIQWESRLDNPFAWELIPGSRVVITDGVGRRQRAGRKKKSTKQANVGTLPALCEGGRLTVGRGRVDYTMTVDGAPHAPRRALIASKLGVGFHLIELTRADPKTGKQARLQIPLSVISPIELKFPPITEITLKRAKNGGTVKLHLSNRSRSEHAVRLELDSMPSGWMALRLGKPVLVLKPGRSAEVRIQVERMIVADVTPEPLSFSIRASFPGAGIPDAHANFYVIAREEHRRAKKLAFPRLTTM